MTTNIIIKALDILERVGFMHIGFNVPEGSIKAFNLLEEFEEVSGEQGAIVIKNVLVTHNKIDNVPSTLMMLNRVPKKKNTKKTGIELAEEHIKDISLQKEDVAILLEHDILGLSDLRKDLDCEYGGCEGCYYLYIDNNDESECTRPKGISCTTRFGASGHEYKIFVSKLDN